ncbi:sensor histidine kinase [Pallidibacillus pasinlerensis]|uniref:histidine kinase n=1 Tax=Pallidibacillus pasinlerensis TaxID=2703818 RepID=A0ABX0A560_9BACI|nr:HAMP domain-containing sensor histidine kinase [Pallidibacillus pasinlerensis]NCU17646.1 HAMP domain-containing histidine kinase [Pallidibacillus pasinlerensis]
MLRNREFKWYLIMVSIISMAAVIGAAYFSVYFSLFLLLLFILFIGVNVRLTRYRYQEIEKLSEYLRKIASGDYALDVRENVEGEISILKNEIYKVTLRLSEHRLLLEKEKAKLTEAISNISHQLKTPITSMTVMVELLANPALPKEKRVQFTQKLLRQLERMDWLVTSLLKLAKIDAGTANFKQERVSVKKLVDLAAEPMLIPMDIKNQTLEVSGDENTSFMGDLKWTIEAIVNILKNCIEHTPEGGKITIRYEENSLYTLIEIQDNGKGIPREDLPHIFKRFYKGKNAGSESVGIGLAMAHSIVKNQMGTLEVQSVEGEGTKFYIKFFKQVI